MRALLLVAFLAAPTMAMGQGDRYGPEPQSAGAGYAPAPADGSEPLYGGPFLGWAGKTAMATEPPPPGSMGAPAPRAPLAPTAAWPIDRRASGSATTFSAGRYADIGSQIDHPARPPAAAPIAAPAPLASAAPTASRTSVRFYSLHSEWGLRPDPIVMPKRRPPVLIGPPEEPDSGGATAQKAAEAAAVQGGA